MSDDLPTARDHVTPEAIAELTQEARDRGHTGDSAAALLDEHDPEGPGRDDVETMAEEAASGLSIVVLRQFKAAAKNLKASEAAYRDCFEAQRYRDAQQAYAEAVKQLSEEAVK